MSCFPPTYIHFYAYSKQPTVSHVSVHLSFTFYGILPNFLSPYCSYRSTLNILYTFWSFLFSSGLFYSSLSLMRPANHTAFGRKSTLWTGIYGISANRRSYSQPNSKPPLSCAVKSWLKLLSRYLELNFTSIYSSSTTSRPCQ